MDSLTSKQRKSLLLSGWAPIAHDLWISTVKYDLDIIRYYLFYELISAISVCKIYLTGPVAQYNT